ncbi:MAG: formate dehydrogenase accessory sulfurtransferase FdhD [Phycisphaerae bacterium]|nr:formate dehydrogenase accessory sulfurtransferase FdhD [Phycisphaerae bacterium]
MDTENEITETSPLDCHELGPEGLTQTQRHLIAEEPLLIAVGGKDVATLMCTPGHEVDLALGWLITEGIIGSHAEVAEIDYRRDDAWGNIVRVTPAQDAPWESRLTAHRKVYTSCGICGYEAIREVAACLKPFDQPKGRLTRAAIHDLAALMRTGQPLFKQTGATHAAALAGLTDGRIDPESLIVREDIGRHNALDKVVGHAVRAGIPLASTLVMLSGRLSFEMVAKAARAGIPNLTAVSAPTALAVDLAQRLRMFLAGFVRGDLATVYADPEALHSESAL